MKTMKGTGSRGVQIFPRNQKYRDEYDRIFRSKDDRNSGPTCYKVRVMPPLLEKVASVHNYSVENSEKDSDTENIEE